MLKEMFSDIMVDKIVVSNDARYICCKHVFVLCLQPVPRPVTSRNYESLSKLIDEQ